MKKPETAATAAAAGRCELGVYMRVSRMEAVCNVTTADQESDN